MPSLQDIRDFNKSLVRLADEEEVVREWGEEIEEPPQPEAGLDNDLTSLLADMGDLSGADLDEGMGFAEGAEVGTGEDLAEEGLVEGRLDDLLSDEIEDETTAEELPGPEFREEDEGQTEPVGDDVDFSDFEALLSDQTFDESLEDEGEQIEPAGEETELEEAIDFGEEEEFEAPTEREGPEEFEEPSEFEPFEEFETPTEPEGPEEFEEPSEFEPFEEFETPTEPEAPEEFEEPSEFEPFEELEAPTEPETPEVPDEEAAIEAPVDFGEEDLFEEPAGFEEIPEFGEITEAETGELPDEFAGEEAPSETIDFAEEAEQPAFEDFSFEDTGLPEEPFGPGEDETPDADLDTGEFEGFPVDDSFTFEDEGEEGAEGAAGEEFEPPEGEAEPESFDTDLGAFEFSDEDEEGLPSVVDEGGDFEAPAVPGVESEFEESSAGGEEETSSMEELEEIDTSGIDEFSLGDFGAEFGVLQDDFAESEEDLNPAISVPDVAPAEVVAGAGSFEITEGEFQSFKANLRALPRNLKVEIESLITEAKGTTDEVENLVRRLASGESASEIATVVGRILGRQIRIPRGYEKRSGLEFETERESFAYQFRENILPIVRLVAVIALALGLIGVAGYHLVYRPLYSRSLYREGLALIAEEQYGLGNQTFERAHEVWESDRWFYEYAEKFIDERQYLLAAEKYEQLLFGMTEIEREYYSGLLEERQFGSILLERPPEKKAVLDYARFESEYLEDYERADLLLQLILFDDVTDYDGWLAVGDNNMRWAREMPARYEDARIAYAKLIERYGQTDELLFRMLTYFVRTDNLTEVLRLKNTFQAEERIQVDPARYSEMAGYLIDKGNLDDVEDVLFRALDVDPRLPDVHYQLARYYRDMNIPGSEEVALQNALRYLKDAAPQDGDLLGKLVDTYTRIGENYYDAELYVEAKESLASAIDTYESGLERRVLAPSAMYGRAYARFADILYYQGRQYNEALRFMNLAEANLYDEPNLDYKQGFVLYRNGQVDSALAQFREAAEDPSATTNALLWATGNTYYRRGNYYAAEAYYRELLDRVELQRDNIRFLLLDENESHRSVIEYLIRVNNNLGVTLNKEYAESGDPNLFSLSLVRLTESTEFAENYGRDPETLQRSNAVPLAYLNQRGILYPTPDYTLQIYTEIPQDLDDLEF